MKSLSKLDKSLEYKNFTPVRKNFCNVICVTSVFFAFTVYFATSPVCESLQHSFNFAAVGRPHEVYLELL